MELPARSLVKIQLFSIVEGIPNEFLVLGAFDIGRENAIDDSTIQFDLIVFR